MDFCVYGQEERRAEDLKRFPESCDGRLDRSRGERKGGYLAGEREGGYLAGVLEGGGFLIIPFKATSSPRGSLMVAWS